MRFNEKALTQAAAVLIKREGGKMNYLKMLKLLYVAERKSLLQVTKSITGDTFTAMDKGPLLSHAYDLIKASARGESSGPWCSSIRTDDYDVVLEKDPDNDELSEADEKRIEEVYDLLGHMNEWELVKWTHDNCPEWRPQGGSSTDIPTREIFFAAGLEDDQVMTKELKLHQQFLMERFAAS